MNSPIIISGTGCCLVDQIYPDIDFSAPGILKNMSRVKGDGGLHPGRLVFSEKFEDFTGSDLQSIIEEISIGRKDPSLNVGGPSIVALIHAAQLLHDASAEFRFYGVRGDDRTGQFLQQKLEQTPVILEHFRITDGATPSTLVLSDPGFNNGHGERMFINDIGASWKFGQKDLEESFFEADIVVFGGTALVPGLHDGLTELLIRSKNEGCMTVVNTVYDFRNEFKNPGDPWPLGDSLKSYSLIDLLIVDREEAIHLSGNKNISESGKFFIEQGVKSFIITNGTEDIQCYSDGKLFKSLPCNSYPVSAKLVNDLKNYRGGDTTGCGDNFVGGILASLTWQMLEGRRQPDLVECISWGTVSGGYCCFHLGGTFLEMEAGEKLELVRPYLENYKVQIRG